MSPKILTLLIQVLEFLRDSNFEMTEIYLNQALELDSNNPYIYRLFGVLFALRGKYLVAHEYFYKPLKIDLTYHEAWSNKGNALYELKRFDEAIVLHDKALNLKPDYAEAWSNKGVTLNELKRYDEAIVHYDQALRLKPEYAEAWSNMGNTLQALKCYYETLVHYKFASPQLPTHHA
ncbi:MAG: tetratricopeptide repeat protein [Burkholderiaceae bacterium]|nr:tetratricopeptide repeat protein [Burkholderiaceae bacterium]